MSSLVHFFHLIVIVCSYPHQHHHRARTRATMPSVHTSVLTPPVIIKHTAVPMCELFMWRCELMFQMSLF